MCQAQDFGNFIAKALELLQSCTEPSISSLMHYKRVPEDSRSTVL